MNLKEAFRYQNFLTDMISAANCKLQNTATCIDTKKIHRLSELGDGREDVIEEIEHESIVPAYVIVKFVLAVIEEKKQLAGAIAKAKESASVDIDVLRENNIAIRDACIGLSFATRVKESKVKTNDIAYKFDANGVQQPCRYSVEVINKPAFDVNDVRTIVSALKSEADKNSEAIDIIMVTTAVEYVPPFDVNENYDNVVMDYYKSISKN